MNTQPTSQSPNMALSISYLKRRARYFLPIPSFILEGGAFPKQLASSFARPRSFSMICALLAASEYPVIHWNGLGSDA